MYSVGVDRDHSRLEHLKLFLVVSINFQMVFCSHHPIISISGSKFLRIDFIDLLSSRAYMLRTLFNMQAGPYFLGLAPHKTSDFDKRPCSS